MVVFVSQLLDGLNEQQKKAILTSLNASTLLIASAGSGKALKNGSLVQTPNGPLPIEQLKVGDQVFDTLGGVTEVLGVFPQGEKEVWEVEFSDGTIIECCGEHLWAYMSRTQHRKNNNEYNVATTEELSKMEIKRKRKDGCYDHLIYIPMTKPVAYKEKDLPLHPYLMGAFIGDGYTSRNVVYFSNPEEDVIYKIKSYLNELGYDLSKKKYSKCDYSVVMINKKSNASFCHIIDQVGLLHKRSYEKFIPESYLYGSVHQRLELLRGLIDTDGECLGSYYQYATTSEILAKQVKELAQSLGFTATIRQRNTSYSYKGEKKAGRTSYRITIKPSRDIPKLHTSIKHEKRWYPTKIYARRYIARIQKTERTAPMTCIQVSAPNALFLTNDYVVTHNTRVLTHRIAYLIKEKNINPYHILAITFTNKAAKEMKERLFHLIGEDTKHLTLGTFHKICVQMLKKFGEHIGISSNFSIADPNDQTKLLTNALKELGIVDNKSDIHLYKQKISLAKNKGYTPEKYLASLPSDASFVERQTYHVYEKYQQELKSKNMLDFDDLLMYAVKLLQTSEEARRYYQNRYKYIMVDEHQDTNDIQYEWLRIIGAKDLALIPEPNNMMFIGDDKQSIYAFRGSNVGLILNFKNDFPEGEIASLSQNYRSTQTIVEAGNAVIEYNKNQMKLKAFTANEIGDPILIYEADTQDEEFEYVAKKIKRQIQQGVEPKQIAILYRTNMVAKQMEQHLLRQNVPYEIVGSISFFDKAEIKDTIAYLKVASNPFDDIAMERILSITEHIGKSTITKLKNLAKEQNIALSQTLKQYEPNRKNTKEAIDQLRQSLQEIYYIANIAKKKQTPNAISSMIEVVWKRTKYKEQFDPEKDQSKLWHLDQLLNIAKSYEEECPQPTLDDFLVNMVLSPENEEDESKKNLVRLMTVHASKGLEFDYVYLVAMNEGIFPHVNCIGDEDAEEEERRLAYVAITRAKKKLRISYANSVQTWYGAPHISAKPSRFLNEIPEQLKQFNFF